MTPRIAALVRAAALLGALAASASCTVRGPDWRVKSLYGGGTSTDVLAKPQAVEAFRIDPNLPKKSDARIPEAQRIGDFTITSPAVDVGTDDVAELSAILLDPGTYDWPRAKGCDFTPGVGLRFVKDASRVEIALCFECDELMIFRMGRRVGMEDFDAARPRLVALVKRLFPEDAKIQSLK